MGADSEHAVALDGATAYKIFTPPPLGRRWLAVIPL
jgi:hypothetical protein